MSFRTNVEITGIAELLASLRGFTGKITASLDDNLMNALDGIVTIAQELVPVRTGALRDSIHAEMIGPLHYEFSADMDYAVYVEYGTVRMPAQPFMEPAISQGEELLIQAAYDAVEEAFQ